MEYRTPGLGAVGGLARNSCPYKEHASTTPDIQAIVEDIDKPLERDGENVLM